MDRLPEPTSAQDTPDETLYGSTSHGISGAEARFTAIARCSRGALFQTLWVPGVSFRAVRLGPVRIMRCPAHQRVEVVRIVSPTELTPEERASAAQHPPGRVP